MSIDLRKGVATDEGIQYVTVLPGKSGRKMTVVGVRGTVQAGNQTDIDKGWEETREIQGAWLEVTGHEDGDYIELFVVMPDGTPVGQFAETVYIPPSGKIEQIVSEGTVSFPAGFKVRLRYAPTSAGSQRIVHAYYRMRK